MFKLFFSKLLLLSILINGVLGFSQELPPIINYSTATYGAGNQDWMISQDKNNFLFFANNDGLLEFNGASWNLYHSPNETIVRSVKVINNLVYTGCYMEFGFWKRHSNGQLVYTSLSSKIKNQLIDDEQFWNILNYDQWVIFQSLSRIYIYDTKSNKFNIITPPKGVWKTFKTNNSFYFQTLGEGLFEIENGNSKLVCSDAILKNNKIVNIFTLDNQLVITTQQNGFYKLDGRVLSKFTTNADSELNSNSIYCCQLLSNQSIAVGTISNGIYIITKEGTIQYHIVQNKGISNNTVLSIFEDADKNIWLGLDNGINCINLQSPVTSFTDETGILGTVYASILFQQKLYIGTNQGLFYKNYDTKEELKFIPGTKGQVWSLFEHNGSLFCGHDSGTFIIESTIAKPIFSQSGTWKFEKVDGKPNLLLQGNYYGVSVLEKTNNQWAFRNKISGFDYSAKHFEITKANQIFVSHEYKGIFRFKVDTQFTSASQLFTYNTPSAGKNACLTKFNSSIYYAYKKGIFKLNSKTNLFEKDALLSSIFEKDEYTSGKLIVDNSNKIWLFSKNYIYYFSLSKLNYALKQNAIPIPAYLTNSMLGYENITQISSAIYLIGTTNGYYIININDLSFKNYGVSITNINTNKINQEVKNSSITEEGSFCYDENNITFNYAVPEYNKYINAEYQYKLEGIQDNWSEWNSKSTINFKNLEPGDYVFKVRSKIANSLPENIAIYKFTINKPWYSTNFAVLMYFILLFIAAHYINKAYKNYYSIQREKLIEENNRLLEISALENEQQLMKMKNEQLSQDVDTKNRELAVSNMSLMKKNELLSIIKEDLKKSSEENNGRSLKSVITTINRNITQEDSSWNVFKEAFDSADKDFLNRVKSIHPSLTPNDLRLCAYLRLNLSSKEIAPLLNISVRSIEIKRYRLRKKMDLPHEQGLVEYILSV